MCGWVLRDGHGLREPALSDHESPITNHEDPYMAKTSMINREAKRAKLAKQHAEKRAALKKIISSESASYEEKAEAVIKLQKLPRDSSPAMTWIIAPPARHCDPASV